MAETPKRRKLEKTTDTSQSAISGQKYYCCRCGTAYSRRKGYFPVSHSPMYRKSGYLPWCNECVEEMYDYYRSKLGDKDALRRMCMKFDLYWDEAIYDMVDKTAGVQSRIRSYIGKTNLTRYLDKTFDDTIDREEAEAAKRPQYIGDEDVFEMPPDDVEDEVEVPAEIRLFWGSGYSTKMYEELEERRHYWLGKYPKDFVPDIGAETLIRQICGLEVDIAHDRAAGRSVEKNVKALNDLLGSANLKPVQQKDVMADTDLENMPLGVGIQKWENARPLPTTPDDLKDQSGIIRNVTTWFLGHACKMVGLKNSYCQMYEDAINKYRVEFPEYAEEDDDSFLTDIFGDTAQNEDNVNE